MRSKSGKANFCVHSDAGNTGLLCLMLILQLFMEILFGASIKKNISPFSNQRNMGRSRCSYTNKVEAFYFNALFKNLIEQELQEN